MLAPESGDGASARHGLGYAANSGNPAWFVHYSHTQTRVDHGTGFVQLSTASTPRLAIIRSADAESLAAGIYRAVIFARSPQAIEVQRRAQKELLVTMASPLFRDLLKPEADRLRLRLATMVGDDLHVVANLIERLVQLQEFARKQTMPAEAILAERTRILSL